MIIYGSSISPFVRKLLVYCAEKAIEFELVPVRIGDPDPEFREASPFAKMPALRDDDFSLADSSAIIHYLEAKQPDPPLIPSDPRERGRAIWFEEWADSMLFACGGKMFFNRVVAPRFLGREGDLDTADKAERDELPPLLDYLERVIPESNFLVGDRLTIADIGVASPFVNFAHCGVTVDSARYPKVVAYTASILGRPSFKHWVDRETAFLARQAA